MTRHVVALKLIASQRIGQGINLFLSLSKRLTASGMQLAGEAGQDSRERRCTTMLMRFDPFRPTSSLFGQAGWWRASMPMDAYRQGDRFVVHFDLPGIEPDAVELTVEKDVLTVSANRQWSPEDGTEVILSERPQGGFFRQLILGESLDVEHIEAHYDNGVLTVTIPVAEAAKPRKVAISAGSGQSAITSGQQAA
jgi:HSP20 family protein